MSSANIASTTNQKLDSARKLLLLSQEAKEKWLNSGLESSAIFQLKSAVNGLLLEVATAYSLKPSFNLEDLLVEANKNQLVIPVINELVDLFSRSDSWLSQLEKAFSIQLECRASSVTPANDNLIGTGNDAGASVSFYLASLVELVLRFREESSEY